jgi:anhydro-N-acetylmuramic acid kinase
MNLGGFSNVSFEEKKRIAFDISPVNTVLNFYSNQLGFDDDKGKISTTGLINNSLLNELNNLDLSTNTSKIAWF